MITPKGYTNILAIENYLLTDISDCFQDQVSEWIAQVEKYIENYTGRVFITETATARYYDGNGEIEMTFDDFTDLETLTIDGTEIESDEYYLYPANTVKKDTIVLEQTYFTKDNQNVVLTAKWGYSDTVPHDIAFATTIFVAGIINFSNNAHGEVVSETVGQYSVTYNNSKEWSDYKRAVEILNHYRRIRV